MADNLKNIEDALSKIKTDSNFIKGRIEDNFDAKTSEINKNIVDFANAITKAWSSAPTGKTKSSPVKLDLSKFNSSLTAFGDKLESYGKTISEPVSKLNDSIVEANQYLKAISDHITNQSSTGTTAQQTQNNVGNAGRKSGSDDIHSTVKEILSVLKDIRNGQKANDPELQKLVEENRKTEELYIQALQLKPKDLKKILKDKESKNVDKEKAKELKKAYENKQNEKKNRENEGNSGWKKASKWTDALAGVGKALTERVTTGQTADVLINGVSKLGGVGAVAGGIMSLIKSAFEIGNKEQQSAADYVRSFGGGKRGTYSAQQTARALISSERASKLGYRIEDAYSAMTSFSEAVGRTADHLSRRDLESAVNLNRFGLGGHVVSDFDTFGKSIEETDNFFTQLYGKVSKKGLSFKNVSKAVNDNLKMAQSHTFANGLRGLEAMAEKAVQLKYNMQQVAAFSDKVSTVEGALQAGANLSVLGGTFAQYSDPMQLLYESLNNQEALNDRMIEMFGKSAFWDSTKGEFSMAPEDRMLLKAGAQAAGLNPNEMLNLSYNNARVRRVESQLGSGIDKDTAEYIKNIAQISKNGRAYVTLNGERKNVSELSNADKKMLKTESDKKSDIKNADLGSIYGQTMTIGEKMQAMLDFLQQKLYMVIFKGFDKLTGGYMGGINYITKEGGNKGWSEEKINAKIEEYDKYADDKNFLKQNYSGGWGRAATMAGMRKRYAKALVGHANGYNPDESDILRNVPGNGTIGGNYHADGGTPVLAEKDEFIMNRISSGVYKKELEAMQRLAYNPSVQPYTRNADTSTVMSLSKVSANERRSTNSSQYPQGGNVSGTIKVDIPQTITINLSGAGQIGQYDISNIIKRYVDSFMKEAQIRQSFGGFDKENFYNQSTVI